MSKCKIASIISGTAWWIFTFILIGLDKYNVDGYLQGFINVVVVFAIVTTIIFCTCMKLIVDKDEEDEELE